MRTRVHLGARLRLAHHALRPQPSSPPAPSPINQSPKIGPGGRRACPSRKAKGGGACPDMFLTPGATRDN